MAEKKPAEKNRYADAPMNPDYTIDQDWASYTPQEHDRWNRLAARSADVLRERACAEYRDAMARLDLSGGGVPDMARLSDVLEPMTGWRLVPVAGIVPDWAFFEHLANRRFPAGAFIRPEHELDYLEEPDIFHDIFGHAPLLTNPAYAAFSERYGQAGLRALETGNLNYLTNLYWGAIEFGLVREAGALKLFGAGLMSSSAEAVFALDDPSPNRLAFDLERVMRTDAFIDDFQRTYFVIDSFEALLDACGADLFEALGRVSGHEVIPPGRLVEGDVILHRGSGRYFDAKTAADQTAAE